MSRFARRSAIAGALLCLFGMIAAMLHAQQAAPDVILTNGKIITVDERFRIAQAVAVKGARIVAVGNDAEIVPLAGPNSRRIDLHGKAVIPGLIENHAHFMRAGATWLREVRLDGVESRAQALKILRDRAKTAAPGEWIFTFGGWAHQQFSDDPRPFSRAELDDISPNNPVMIQEAYFRIYLNSRGLTALGIDNKRPPAKWIDRDPTGKPTGVIEQDGVREIAARIPDATTQQFEAGSLAMIRDLNQAGITAFGNAGCEPRWLRSYATWESDGQLNVRVFCIDSFNTASPAQVDKILPQIDQIRLFQGDDFLNSVAYGESVYAPLHDNMLAAKAEPKPDQLFQWRRIAAEIAKRGLPLHVHATLEGSIDAFLTEIEQINQEHPVRNLRWAFAHMDQVNERQLELMKKLGMYAAVGSRPAIMGGIFNDLHGDRSYDMPPLKLIQDSGIHWGFGSDSTVVNQYRPFPILWWAVTGKMVGGRKVNRQPISREDALIAYTRNNAYFIFQEDNLGSIQPGKLADLVVLDRDYLTVPLDQIKDIQTVMTLVAGRIVYQAQNH